MHSQRRLTSSTLDASSKSIALAAPLLSPQNGSPLCKEAIINIIHHLDRNGGPCPDELPYLEQFSRQILASLASETINKTDLAEISRCLGKSYLIHSVNGRSLNKPEGYAGDFMLIEHIYQYLVSPHPQYRNWDLCFHETASAKAVRNRKHYFKEQAASLIIRKPADDFSILTLASGPAREILELYQSLPQHTFSSTCLDADPKALSYAQNLLQGYSDQLEFVKANVFRYQAAQAHDLIWSAGMFDYLNDKLFVYLLKRMKTWLKPNGKIIVGNFSCYNPSRSYMEVFGEWHLQHRSENQLIDLALKAGYEMNQIHIGRESLGVNLFLHLSL